MSQLAPRWAQQLSDPEQSVSAGKAYLSALQTQQAERFNHKAPIQNLLSERSQAIDTLLRHLWKQYMGQTQTLCLLAVGGYGRSELFPCSDIDILVLAANTGIQPIEQQQLTKFITFLWDIGLHPGHAVRTLAECYQLGKDDITIATNYTEARWLIGNYEYFDTLRQLWRKRHFWPSKTYFLAKVAEQIDRHNKAQDVIAQLEPNLKESPGGLRDVHTLVWVTRRHFNCHQLQQLVDIGFLAEYEYQELTQATRFLWRVRFLLHTLVQGKEDRLLFNYQQQLAQQLGYIDHDGKLAVECFMQDYYRHAKHIQRLNQLLLQVFREDIFASPHPIVIQLDAHFELIDGALSLRDPQLFIQQPLAILDCFLWLTHQRVQGIRAQTQRTLLAYAHLINNDFCAQNETWQRFRQLLRRPYKITSTLRNFHLLGLLGRLIPAFHRITGLMQFDLFHAYTVDEHSLLVVRNIRQFLHPTEHTRTQFPLACTLAEHITQADILLLAAIFHDIAKGQGGDHARLGAIEAEQFAQQANLTAEEGALLSWLVNMHLIMSHTAQKKDIHNRAVIQAFCQQVVQVERLAYLYLLTVADICATSPVIWNNWKDDLLKTLYHNAYHYLTQHPTSANEQALHILNEFSNEEQTAIHVLWQSLEHTPYQQQQSHQALKRHAQLWVSTPNQLPKGTLNSSPHSEVINLLLFVEDTADVWLTLTMQCGLAKLNIVSAKFYSSTQQQALIDIKLLPTKHWSHNEQQQWLEQLLTYLHQRKLPPEPKFAKPSRRQRSFRIPTHVSIQAHTHNSELTLISQDRPGLLYHCARVFHQQHIRLISAHISTAGLQAEDIFIISNDAQSALDNAQQTALTTALMQALS